VAVSRQQVTWARPIGLPRRFNITKAKSNGGYRRKAVTAVRSSGGPLIDLTPAAHPLGREPLKMPHCGHPRLRAVFNPSASSARQPGSGRGVAFRGWPEHCSARGRIVQPEVTGSRAVGRALSPRIVRPSLLRASIDAERHDRHRQPSKPPVSTGARPEGTPACGTSGTGCVRCAGGCGGGGCRPAFPAATVPSIPSCEACAIIGR